MKLRKTVLEQKHSETIPKKSEMYRDMPYKDGGMVSASKIKKDKINENRI
jgi:hypothetical protein